MSVNDDIVEVRGIFKVVIFVGFLLDNQSKILGVFYWYFSIILD